MDRERTIRVLKITASAVCGALCVWLIVLWARSCWYFDGLETLTNSRLIRIWTVDGRLVLEQLKPSRNQTVAALHRLSWGRPYLCEPIDVSGARIAATGGYQIGHASGLMRTITWAPHWAFILLFGTFAVAPWIKWSSRFSLRTLLIVATLIAVVLGLIMIA
jgi:hypothetical protein